MAEEPGRRLPYFLLQEIASSLRRTIINFNTLSRAEIRNSVTRNRLDLAECLEFYTSENRDPITKLEELEPLREHLPKDNP